MSLGTAPKHTRPIQGHLFGLFALDTVDEILKLGSTCIFMWNIWRPMRAWWVHWVEAAPR